MKNVKFNSKKLIVILVAGFILITSVACSNETVNSNYKPASTYTEINSSKVETTQDNHESSSPVDIPSYNEVTTSKANTTIPLNSVYKKLKICPYSFPSSVTAYSGFP